ncbi:NDR1/HIN1-like protein 6 [Amaranthus tricolor]|uniref:NDR1/HIN1-like protein 6 n=1 Tax=Amaranthus tricolor TaxID=29722 RepID=UPI00258E7797|nr:NDR1/HIN1-like protein 6 [Amaranthus tricolor]
MADHGLKKPPGFRDTTTPSKPPLGPKKPVVRKAIYQPKKERRNCCRGCCCCFTCFIFLFFLLIIAFFGIFYAWYQPKIPIFRFKPIEFNRFVVTPKSDGTAIINSQITFRVEVKNPNSNIKIYYGETKVSITADQETELGSASVPEFTQRIHNITLLKFTAGLDNRIVDSTVGIKLKERVKNKKVVLNAEVKTKIGIGVFNVKIGMLPVNVNCGGLSLKEINDGNSSPKCSFNTLRWYNYNSNF